MGRHRTSLRILITDAHELAGLGAVRSLGRAGHQVTAAWPAGLARPASGWSRRCAGHLRYPDPWHFQHPFRDWLRELLQRRAFDVILPITEASIVAMDALREEAPAGTILLLPDRAALRYTLSKYHATARALEAAVACPRTVFLDCETPFAQRLDAVRELGFPVVIKTDNYLTASGIYRKGRLRMAADAGSAAHILRDVERLPTRAIAQETIAGSGVGAFLLRHDGQVALRFAHRRLHEVPYTGGYSSLRASCHDPDVIGLGEKMLAAIDYEGVAMVEFRRRSDGELFFLEINGRLWGSLALALHCGVDFPKAMLECPQPGRSARPADSYRDGVICRNVFPGETGHLLSILKAKPAPGGPPAPGPPPPSKIKALAEFAALSLNPWIRHDHFWWSDPLPGIVQAGKMLTAVSGKVIERAGRWVARRKDQRMFEELRREHERRKAQSAYFDPPPRRILFVCLGNICRSPFAAAYWNLRAEREPGLLPLAASVGFIAQPGRPTPSRLVELAAEFGVDLGHHRSKPIDRAEVEAADAIFVMDHENYRDLLLRYPQARAKTLFLGLFAEDGAVEIEDPFMREAEQGRLCYRRLARALDGLRAVLSPGVPGRD